MFQDWESGSGDIPIILSTIFVYIQVHKASLERRISLFGTQFYQFSTPKQHFSIVLDQSYV